MARRVFFSFHYERDVWRASVVRNSWRTKEREAAGFFDAGIWEEAKKKGDAAIKAMIDSALNNTSVTAVLIGNQTANRDYVKYEIDRSIGRGKGVFGVMINLIENSKVKRMSRGRIHCRPATRPTSGSATTATRTSAPGLRQPPRPPVSDFS